MTVTRLTRQPESMADVLAMYIKDVIAAYPGVGGVLSRAGIGCVTCSVGTCLLRDVVSIHQLTKAQEQLLFAGIAAEIFPGRAVELPRTERKPTGPARPARLSPPIQALVDEHTRIKRVLAVIDALAGPLSRGLDGTGRQAAGWILEFVRGYADRYHHAKEEDILFKFFDGGSDILTVMCKEHNIGRGYVRSAVEAVERGDAAGVVQHLTAYAALLREHIRKEDEILYPWMNRELSDSQVGRLFAAFRQVDEALGQQATHCVGLMEKLEQGITPERTERT